MIYRCCNEMRKDAILTQVAQAQAAHLSVSTPNGINYLEVLDQGAPAGVPRQQTLFLHCLYDLGSMPVPVQWSNDNLMIEGGESVTGIQVSWVIPADQVAASTQSEIKILTSVLPAAPELGKVLVIRTNERGDFSKYRLRLVNSAGVAGQDPFEVTETLAGFDPQLAAVEFSFKVECDLNFDCAPPAANCPPANPVPPLINYLAKDYGSFRSIIIDRLNQLLPAWGGASEADFGIVLAELIAYVGDQLSYRQDAIGTEAYLETARSRISLRRHARLVDYHVHDGANARVWMQLQVAGNAGAGVPLVPSSTRFYTNTPGMPASLAANAGNEEAAVNAGVVVFEPMQGATLYPEHNLIYFYTWGDTDCCLPAGATEATLLGSLTNLKPGDVLIFQEVLGPQTGAAADADIRHRCAVRLTQVATLDSHGDKLQDTLFSSGPVTEIQWAEEDALTFPLCISSTYLDANQAKQSLPNVSVALGNVVLADHGLAFKDITLGTVPEPWLFLPPNPAADRCHPASPTAIPPRFRPRIADSPLTQAAPLPLAGTPVTPGVVPLASSGVISLADDNGYTSLMVQITPTGNWPQNLGVTVKANGALLFDLEVVYLPFGAAQVTLEAYTGLSFTPGDPNYVVTQINTFSNLIQVPVNPPTAAPTTYPSTPTMLANSGPVDLQSGNPVATFLTVQATNPAVWPPSFGLVVQSTSITPPAFNLVVVYDPPAGAVGVVLPVTVELFASPAMGDLSAVINGTSHLITVESFSDTPNPALSATALRTVDPAQSVPVISLTGTFEGTSLPWTVEQDLLENKSLDRVFVVEVDTDGTAMLRFGDDTSGKRPDSGTTFTASYRIGNGSAGNVGADSLIMLAAADARIESCRNPLPAIGGTDPETNDQIRRRAPQAFLTQERAVTMADYAAMTELNPQVDEAVATLRWTGSWYTVFVAVEPHGGGNLTSTLARSLQGSLERYRLAGQDLLLDSPQYVSLEIKLAVCVDPDYFRSHVKQSLLQVLGSGIPPDGAKGLFYPDNFTFGQTVYLSPIYAAARSVAGVLGVTATVFQTQGINTRQYLEKGEIPMASLQVARLANDPNYPSHGKLTLYLEGGK